MILKDLIDRDFGVKLPISGGFGNSIDNAIIIHKDGNNDYVVLEHFILKCLGRGRKIKFKTLVQELITYNDKKIDKIKIETKEVTESEIITQIENYYFDITECFGNKIQQQRLFDEELILEKIKERIAVLENRSDFNKKCVELLKNDELFNDTQMTIEFLDVLRNDESMPLFESMMENKRKPVMAVLRIIGRKFSEDHNK